MRFQLVLVVCPTIWRSPFVADVVAQQMAWLHLEVVVFTALGELFSQAYDQAELP